MGRDEKVMEKDGKGASGKEMEEWKKRGERWWKDKLSVAKSCM